MRGNIQASLLKLAGLFLVLQASLITLSPIVRERSWGAVPLWTHWLALLVWGILILRVQRAFAKSLPDADPYLFPVAAFLSGWGMLTIWRLEPAYGARQALWLFLSVLVFMAGMQLTSLKFLQRYKYILLVGGLGLTTLTLIFGTSPSGVGPRLWLGAWNIYFQPSEPLKLILIVYLAAYFSDKLPYRLKIVHILYPTMILGGIMILLLAAQRDLGTASIFLALYAMIAYLATNRRRLIVISVLTLVVMGIAGYYFVNIVQIRVETWLYPWNDPQGGSYQVIQSLIAIANGGVEGRGPGLGNPGLVPVALSDFVYAAIAEETGLIGTVGMLALFGILFARGIRAALHAPDIFRRLLAGGVSAYFGLQTILIVGGNTRLLPLTGVTLPFVSYGGSSLFTSFTALLLLLLVSNPVDEEPAPLENPAPFFALHRFLLLGLFVCALCTGWWALVRGPDLLSRTDNLRRVIAEKYVPRGAILDRSNSPISVTSGAVGSLRRRYLYTDLAPVVGYNEATYGQAGLESALDGYLRGLQGSPASTIWLNRLLYGTSPPGLDVRLSIDLPLQSRADHLMIGKKGAVILLDAGSGEILVMASHPTFDANRLIETGAGLLADPDKPLINRPALGLYPTDTVVRPFAEALYASANLSREQWQTVYEKFGFLRSPPLQMETVSSVSTAVEFYVSPLQMALASAALCNGGEVPAPRIVLAVNTPREGWVVLPAEGTPMKVGQPSAMTEAALSYAVQEGSFWSYIGTARDDVSSVTWFIGGTLPSWQASPLTLVLLLEEDDPLEAGRIGGELLGALTNP
ncbi:MAG: FtsW/RodA/SpoVE family cell cycle protein [Chloroflexi bacterium]|nr:FtsW/RodA/SpoVE family cell cycle protein [Chloroflexota bacterium]